MLNELLDLVIVLSLYAIVPINEEYWNSSDYRLSLWLSYYFILLFEKDVISWINSHESDIKNSPEPNAAASGEVAGEAAGTSNQKLMTSSSSLSKKKIQEGPQVSGVQNQNMCNKILKSLIINY